MSLVSRFVARPLLQKLGSNSGVSRLSSLFRLNLSFDCVFKSAEIALKKLDFYLTVANFKLRPTDIYLKFRR